MNDIFNGVGIEIKLKNADDFLKVKETLTRIGVLSVKNNTLYQSCHILHKRGRYVILHFKELFVLDGKNADLTEEDYIRRDTIANLLDEWGLIKIVDKSTLNDLDLKQLKIVPFKEKNKWKLETKYSIGRKI